MNVVKSTHNISKRLVEMMMLQVLQINGREILITGESLIAKLIKVVSYGCTEIVGFICICSLNTVF